MVATSTLKNKNTDCISDLIDHQYDQAFLDELAYWEHALVEPSLGGGVLGVLEEQACLTLASLLEGCLSRAKRTALQCAAVLVPDTLTRRVARDMLRLSRGEPCGLRGCLLHVLLEDGGGGCTRIERLAYDPAVVPTFELTLVLKRDGSGWPGLRHLLRIGACFSMPRLRPALKLSPAFRLVKRKLYSSSAGAVVEC